MSDKDMIYMALFAVLGVIFMVIDWRRRKKKKDGEQK